MSHINLYYCDVCNKEEKSNSNFKPESWYVVSMRLQTNFGNLIYDGICCCENCVKKFIMKFFKEAYDEILNGANVEIDKINKIKNKELKIMN